MHYSADNIETTRFAHCPDCGGHMYDVPGTPVWSCDDPNHPDLSYKDIYLEWDEVWYNEPDATGRNALLVVQYAPTEE